MDFVKIYATHFQPFFQMFYSESSHSTMQSSWMSLNLSPLLAALHEAELPLLSRCQCWLELFKAALQFLWLCCCHCTRRFEPLSRYSVIPVMTADKMKHQCSESWGSFEEAALQCTGARFEGGGGKEATAQQLSCKLCNPWTTLVVGALCSQKSTVSRMAHFLRDCTHAGPRAHCGLLSCWVCLLWAFLWFCLRHSWLSYSSTVQSGLSTFGLQGVHCLRLHQLRPFSVFALHFSLDSSRTWLSYFVLGS